MSSSWSNKLETRLAALADSASKESLQTLAKWMCFNRKHASAFASALAEAVAKAGPARKWLYLQLVHEVLIINFDDDKKWERQTDLRIALAETFLVPSMSSFSGDDRVTGLVNQWDEKNVFSGPTLLSQIRKAFATPPKTDDTPLPSAVESSSSEQPVATEAAPAAEPISEELATESDQARPIEDSTLDTTKEEEATQTLKEEVSSDSKVPPNPESKVEPEEAPSSTQKEQAEKDAEPEKTTLDKPAAKTEEKQALKFDFEKEGIPEGRVVSREFLEPCRAIATLQIARELRSDSALQLSSILSTIPEDVMKVCEAAKEEKDKNGEAPQFSEEQINEFSMKLNEEVLELDLDEILQNIETFQEIVQKQSAARERLIYLLIKSRCQFGSNEAAQAFYNLEDTAKLLQNRKELLVDAMALEGLDVEEEKAGKTDQVEAEKELQPLSWYEASEPDPKRARHH